MEQPNIIINKKGRRKRGELQHGGWKVAMADLMISLMCLFLVLWILQVVDVDDQKKLLNYFAYGNDPIMHLGTNESGGNSINPLPLPHVATSHYDAELHRINDTSVLEGNLIANKNWKFWRSESNKSYPVLMPLAALVC